MANRTVKEAASVKGTNPQYLVEKIIRLRVYESRYWKEECFALTAELLVDKAVALRYIGGIYGGNVKPTPFICLLVKMLQIQPEKEIIMEFIRQETFKYMRLLGAVYLRLTASSIESYKYLEPLLNDYRKVRRMNKNGHFELTYVDELIDEMLHDERIIDITLPRLQKRYQLEENNEIDPRVSLLDEDLAGGDDEAGRTSSSSSDEEPPEREPEQKKRRRDESSEEEEEKETSEESSSDDSSDRDRRHQSHRGDRRHRSRSRDRHHRHHRHHRKDRSRDRQSRRDRRHESSEDDDHSSSDEDDRRRSDRRSGDRRRDR